VEQKREPMNKNRIRGIRRRTSGPTTAKSVSIQGAGCRSGGCAPKAVELTSGDLLSVWDARLRAGRSALIRGQKSAEGIVGAQALKARTVPARGSRERQGSGATHEREAAEEPARAGLHRRGQE